MELRIFASGSSGNCAMLSSPRGRLLIDAGISMRRISSAVRADGGQPENLAGILVTHAHSDHIGGLKMMSKYYRLPVYCTAACADELCRAVPESAAYIEIIEPGSAFFCAGLEVTAFRTSHDSPGSVGYRMSDGTHALAFVTDLGWVSPEVEDAVIGADAAVLEANHDPQMLKSGPYPYYLKERIFSRRGHLSNEESAALAINLAAGGARQIVLAHLSRENNSPDIALKTVSEALRAAGCEAAVSVARRDECTEKVII